MYFIQLTTITTLCSAHEEQIFSTIFLSPYKFPRRTTVLDIHNDVRTAWRRRMHTVHCNMSMSNVPDSHNVPIFTVSRVSQTKTTEYLRCFSPSIIIETFHIVTDNLHLSSRIQGEWTCRVQQTSRLTTLALAPVPASCIFHWISTFLSVDG